MPRFKRKISCTKVYHIILRGINKQDIFLENNDFKKFLKILKETKEKYEYEIYSYCLMNNHIHLIIFDKNDNLSKIMQSIAISYSIYFNKRYDRVGHLFQNRFSSKEIENENYLKTACRYIHQNPLKACISKTEDYRWSSYQGYFRKNTIINSNVILSLFSIDKSKAREEFIKFHNIESNREIADLIEYELKKNMTDEQLDKYICELINIEKVSEILKFDKKKRNEVLIEIKKNKKITSAQIARVIGISKKIVERAK